ncbi:MAG: alkaline phosphatase family protein [Candidatus Sulfotelmatobacter sp.]
MKLSFGVFVCAIAATVLQAGCGGGSGGSTSPSGTGTGASTALSIPQFQHVFVIVEENHSYSDVMGNASMPYLNSLASANASATQYYADAHPSLPNYFMLTVGAGTPITGSAGDSYDGVVTQDNVVRALTAAGKTWKCYAESIPSIGYLGNDVPPYLQHHNPFVYLSDVQGDAAQANNIVPFTQLATDIRNNTLPDYGFIVPNIYDDAHNCPVGMSTCTNDQMLAPADNWLSTNIAPLLASAGFKNSLLIITFDESEDSDSEHGGGHVPAILISPSVKAGYQSTTFYQHESTLRVMMKGLGVTDLPGAAATAPDMSEFFQ